MAFPGVILFYVKIYGNDGACKHTLYMHTIMHIMYIWISVYTHAIILDIYTMTVYIFICDCLVYFPIYAHIKIKNMYDVILGIIHML